MLGLQTTTVAGSAPLAPGRRRLVMTFEYDGGGPGRGGAVRLLVDGEQVAAGRLEQTIPLVFSLDETCDVGRDSGSSVTDDYLADASAFTGTIEQVRIDLADATSDFTDLIDPEHRVAVALARQ